VVRRTLIIMGAIFIVSLYCGERIGVYKRSL